MDDGTESALGAVADCRLRFFGSLFFFFTIFFSFFFSVSFFSFFPPLPSALLLLDDDRAPPSAPYPSQSGMDTPPASRYVFLGQLGISKGRLSLLLYSSHSFCPPSFSDRTNVLAASKDNHVTLSLSSYPSQSE